jgi:hypothetical protein
MITGSALLAIEQHPKLHILGGSFVNALLAIGGDITNLPALDACLSIKSGHQGVYGTVGALGLNGTNNVSVGNLAVPLHSALSFSRLPTRWEGRQEVTVGDGGGYVAAVAIDGCGLLFEDNPFAAYFMRPYSWLMAMYTGYDPLAITSGSLGTLPGNELLPYMAVLTGKVGVQVNGQWAATTKSSDPGLNQVEHPWFRKGIDLTIIEAQDRITNALINPWVRADGEDGFVHATYEPTELHTFFNMWRDELKALGSNLQLGLSDHSLWMEIQQIN